MTRFIIAFVSILLMACGHNTRETLRNNVHDGDSTLATGDTTEHVSKPAPEHKLSIIVFPPYDKIANEGISPDVQKYLETQISKDSTVTLIEFPYRKLMTTPYHNVYDKKYCKPVLDKVKADVVVMSKLDQNSRSGNMTTDGWNLTLRIYNPTTDTQTDSKIRLSGLTDRQIEKALELRRSELITEIKANR